MKATSPSPVSFPVHVARLPKKGMRVTIDADASQREALSRAHGLVAVEEFRVELDVTAWKRGGIRIDGRVAALIVQQCGVTLEPVEEHLDEAVAALFLPEGSKLALPKRSAEGEILLDAEGEDAPELFSGDTVDVGELAEEFFALAINPYPRRANISANATGEGEAEKRGPLYEKLEALRKKL